jgi:fatty-acid peroxygenase
LLGRPAALVGGPEGVRRFYDPRLRRHGAIPLPVRRVLFGAGTVHGLDDAEHHARKALFLDVLTPDRVAALGRRSDRLWPVAMSGWGPEVVLFDEAVQVIGAAVLPWAGIPLAPGEGSRRARQLAAVVDGFATPGRPYARAVAARAALDRWSRGLVRRTRAGAVTPPAGTALRVVADAPLPVRAAATELLNVVRPTVATAWFAAYAGQAVAEHPDLRERIAAGDHVAAYAFAQEVRRRYPFVPVLAAKARHRQDVLGVPVPRGGLVVLDVHGTDHDPAWWPDPEAFRPERFLDPATPLEPDALVPQGGGRAATGHRSPGESVVLSQRMSAVRALAGAGWTLPPQELVPDPARMPSHPPAGPVLRTAPQRAGE